jgi:glycosyltransferase involved in cell wall biosynthesis
MPRVSVVIPAYNCERYIGESVQSVLDQTYHDLEVIVVDDGSTDSTAGVVCDMTDCRIRLIRESNGGQASARNSGIRIACGELIAFNDGDDVWAPNKLELQIAHLDAHSDLGCVYCLIENFWDDGTVGSSGFQRKLRGWVFPEMLEDPFICTQQALIPRKVLDECGPFDETFRMAGQSLLFLRLAMRYPIDYIDQVLVWRRRHEQNISKTGGTSAKIERAQTRCRILERIYYEEGGKTHVSRRFAREVFADAYCTLGEKQRLAGDLELAEQSFRQALGYCPWHLKSRLQILLTRLPLVRAA